MNKKIAIIDYNLGNLFSVQQACKYVGIDAIITNNIPQILDSSGIILPGVGSFNSAIKRIIDLGLDKVIKAEIKKGKPFMGICLGFQLLFTESEEFCLTKGLDIIAGRVIKFHDKKEKIRIPHIGWNKIQFPENTNWNNTILNQLDNFTFMYFVHSFYVIPKNNCNLLTITDYGNIRFCSGIKKDNIYGFQFHPEKSGINGLKIYNEFKKIL